jgi:hypothetical protein
MGKSKSTWFIVTNHGPHRFANDQRVSVCGKVARTAAATPLSKAPAEGCAACGGKQPVEQPPANQSGDTQQQGDESNDAAA